MALSLTSRILGCLFVVLLSQQYVQGQSSQVTITNNGYNGVVVAIAPQVSHTIGDVLIERIKEMFIGGSKSLYSATRQRAYFEHVTILVPQAWPRKPEYSIAGSETFGLADVRIDDPDPEHGDGPYTLQPLGCASPGLFIHLTPGYLLDLHNRSEYNYGDSGKVLVHEWAHFRYGIFDEYGYAGNPVFPLYYHEGDELVPNSCTNKKMDGVFWDVQRDAACTYDNEGNPNEGCIFTPNLNGNDHVKSSLDSYHFLKNVDSFCDDSEEHAHNPRAPNKHNLLCEGRSTWNVIEGHKDFAGGQNMPRAAGNIIPKFTVVQQMEATYSLVLDISGSMAQVTGGNMPRRQILYETVKRWLQEEVQLGAAVGIIIFDTLSTIQFPIQKIDTEQKRQQIISKIPNMAEASTCIGCGLKTAIEELKRYRKGPGGIIILVTDGEETNHPFIMEVLPELVKAQIRVVAIALHTQNSANLETAAKQTGGKIFSIPVGAGVEKLGMAFFEALTYQASEFDLAQKIHSEKFSGTSQTFTGQFNIDSTIGNDTIIDFTTGISNDITGVTIKGTKGFSATSTSAIVEEKLVRFKFPSLKEDKYTYTITRRSGNPADIQVSITSKARSKNTKPIVTKCWVQEESTSTPSKPRFVILAEVKQGNNPIINAAVIAKIDRPSKKAVTLQLFDNGNGAPDVSRNDGIYAAYFTRFAGKGRYSVSAQVTDDGKAAIRQVGFTGSRVMRIPHGYPGNLTINDTATGEFDRESEGGTITIENELDEDKGDIFPPNRVTDLRVYSVSRDRATAILKWTAPGDDYDYGNASSYDIRYSTDWDQLSTNFSTAPAVNMTGIRPLPSGQEETFKLYLPQIPYKVSYFAALQAKDDAGLVSKTSNIVQIPRGADYPPVQTTPNPGDGSFKITVLNIKKIVVEGRWIPQWVKDLLKSNTEDIPGVKQ